MKYDKPLDIKETWAPSLAEGEATEREFLLMLRVLYPAARKIEGAYKFGDLIIPELDNMLVEVKRDIISDRTGNFAVEYSFRGKPSGLATTKAAAWVVADEQDFYCFKTAELRRFLRVNWHYLWRRNGGDGNDARMIIFSKKWFGNQTFCTCVPRDGSRPEFLRAFFRMLQ